MADSGECSEMNINSFMKLKGSFPSRLFCNLAFLTDVTDHLKALKLKLQNREPVIRQMQDTVISLKLTLTLGKETLGHFGLFLNSG